MGGEAMNSNELATIMNLNPTTITRKVEKAKEANQHSIKLGDRFFKFEVIKGHYAYEEIFAEVVDTSDTALSAAWRRASEEQQELASKRLAVVRLYRNRPSGENWKKFLGRIEYKYKDIKPSKSKLFRWLKIVQECEARGEIALEHLLDTRGKQTGNRSYTDAQWVWFARVFLENPSRMAVKIHEYMKHEFKDACPSYSTVIRMIEKYKRENVLIYTVAKDPGEANNKLRPAPGNASEVAQYNNALWEMDGTPVDVMCSDGVRYALSAAIDVYSRRPIVVVTPSANATALAKVFKKGIQKLGLPEAVLLDNGKEYKSKTFEYTCARLRIEQRFTMPYSGWQKPHIERFFGTLTRDLFEELPGYKGHNVAEAKEIQNRNTYEAKMQAKERAKVLMKQGNAAAKRLAKQQKEEDIYLPTTLSRDELEAYIEKWIVRYENRNHRGIHQAPKSKWDECVIPTKTISDARVLDVLVGLSVKKKITKKGVTWHKKEYWHDLFYDRVKESVWVLSDDDLGYIYVYDLDMNFICKAENAEDVGKSRAAYLASFKFDAKTRKLIRELQEIRREMPDRFKVMLDEVSEEEPNKDVALEFKTEVVSSVRESLSDESTHSKEEIETLLEVKEETVVLNGRPVFNSISERFEWALENNDIDKVTQKLADKHEELWQMAVEEYESRKAG
jgi:transposase InsO family protein